MGANWDLLGAARPEMRSRVPGPNSKSWRLREAQAAAPMGPAPVRGQASGSLVYHFARGVNVLDVDDNVYVDLAAGFGSLLLGHGHPAVIRAVEVQSGRLFQAMGDVHTSAAKIALLERLSKLFAGPRMLGILAQSGADAVTAALKSAVAATGRPGVIAFRGGYHGLSYAPLAASAFRESYRAPFAEQLNPHVRFLDYPADDSQAERCLSELSYLLKAGESGALLVEPVLGRGGVVVPPEGFVRRAGDLAREAGALLVVDEIWSGLGRAGRWLFSEEASPDLICLGKGLGGGLPISACLGKPEVMQAWRRRDELVHTSTFAGAPLACAAALCTLETLRREKLVERSQTVGDAFKALLTDALSGFENVTVRGAALMIGIDLGERPGAAVRVCHSLLSRGFIASTGGTRREVVVFTPPLTLPEELMQLSVAATEEALQVEFCGA